MKGPLLEVAEYLEEKARKKGISLQVTQPPEGMGDLSIPIGFALSKKLGGNPEKHAQTFAESIEHPAIEQVDVVNGYVNIWVKNIALFQGITPDLGRNLFSGRILIDYSSPNIAKPLHVGHMKSTIVGGAIYNISKFVGFEAIGENWLGDIGTQFGKLIVAYKLWVDKEAFEKDPIKELLRLYVKFHEEAEKDPQLEALAREAYKKLEEGDPEHVRLWKLFREMSIKKFQKFYDLFDVKFDRITGESYYLEHAKRVVEELKKRGLLVPGKEKDGKPAWIVDLENVGLGKPVMLKSDGTTTYESRDLGTLVARFKELKPDVMIYVVGAEQSFHFQQVFYLAKLLGVTSKLIHVKIGLVRLPEGKLSTRKGRIITAEEVWDKVLKRAKEEMESRGVYDENAAKAITRSAIAFQILKVNPERETIFDWEKMLSLKGETGPYCIYAAVRAKHVLDNAESYAPKFAEPNELERQIMIRLALFPLILRDFPKNFDPSPIARHFYALAELFNKFYDTYRILGSGKENFRLWLTEQVYRQMETLAHLLLMKIPERM